MKYETQYVVMAGVEWPAKSSFARNAICQSKAEADEEARRRNQAEAFNGNKGVTWFVVEHDAATQKLYAEINAMRG